MHRKQPNNTTTMKQYHVTNTRHYLNACRFLKYTIISPHRRIIWILFRAYAKI